MPSESYVTRKVMIYNFANQTAIHGGKTDWSCVNGEIRNKSVLIIPSSGLLRSVRWFDTDVSGLPIGPIFKGQVIDVSVLSVPSTRVKLGPVVPKPPHAA